MLVSEFYIGSFAEYNASQCGPLQKPINQVIRLIGLVVLLESSFAITSTKTVTKTVTEVVEPVPVGILLRVPGGPKNQNCSTRPSSFPATPQLRGLRDVMGALHLCHFGLLCRRALQLRHLEFSLS